MTFSFPSSVDFKTNIDDIPRLHRFHLSSHCRAFQWLGRPHRCLISFVDISIACSAESGHRFWSSAAGATSAETTDVAMLSSWDYTPVALKL